MRLASTPSAPNQKARAPTAAMENPAAVVGAPQVAAQSRKLGSIIATMTSSAHPAKNTRALMTGITYSLVTVILGLPSRQAAHRVVSAAK